VLLTCLDTQYHAPEVQLCYSTVYGQEHSAVEKLQFKLVQLPHSVLSQCQIMQAVPRSFLKQILPRARASCCQQ
jgi:hypothetical protein